MQTRLTHSIAASSNDRESVSNFIMKVMIVLGLIMTFAASIAAGMENNYAAANSGDQPDLSRPVVVSLFGDGMVLQRNLENPIWGWTKPGDVVTVKFADDVKTATAGQDGKWMLHLKSLPAGGPYTMDITCASKDALARLKYTAGDDPKCGHIHIKDILIGDVWLCSGQSNMEMGMTQIDNSAKEIAEANNPMIRYFIQPRIWGVTPRYDGNGAWKICTPENVADKGWGGFSAVAYFFARDLQKDLNIPIGIVESAWGGTPVEAWTSAGAITKHPDFKDAPERLKKLEGINDRITLQSKEWMDRNDAKSLEYAAADFDDTPWSKIEIPFAHWGSPLWERAGVTWYRRTFDLKENAPLTGAEFLLGRVFHFDTVWINGKEIGHGAGEQFIRSYTVPDGLLRPGKNTIVVRVLNRNPWAGGIDTETPSLAITLSDRSVVSLKGTWSYKPTVNLADCSGHMPPDTSYAVITNEPVSIYNGMIAPIETYGITGALWYQGENNAARAYQYRSLLPIMIDDWRKRWNQGSFPFYIVQLPNFSNYVPHSDSPVESDWAELREAQAMTAKSRPNVELAVTIDLGNPNDIHPRNKKDVSRRLARIALAKHYNKPIAYSGPVYKSHKIDGDKIRISFEHGDGLIAKDGKLIGFAIAGKDKRFVWADAIIDGDTVIVSSPQVANPVAVRYAWANNPTCNLYNKAGLPAGPFRTDNWPGITVNNQGIM